MIELSDLEYAYTEQVIKDYLSKEHIINFADWNDRDIKLLHIAFFILLNNTKPKMNIEPSRLAQIRKTVSSIRTRIEKNCTKSLSEEWFSEAFYIDEETGKEITFDGKTFHELNLEDRLEINKEGRLELKKGRLGKYAKYFIRDSKEPHSKDIENKYIFQKAVYVLNCANGVKDDIQIIKDFLDHVEEERNDYLELYKNVRAYNQNTKSPKLKPSDIDDSLKLNLSKRLSSLELKDEKLQRILSNTMKAIKKEILQLK